MSAPRIAGIVIAVALATTAARAQEDSLPPTDTLRVAVSPEAAPTTPAAPADTLHWRARHSPPKATLLSAVVPGAGQIYNRKYWKAPIVWAGLGTCVWFIQDNHREYHRYRDAYLALVDDDPATVDEFNGQYAPEQVRNVMDTYRQWRDLSYLVTGLVYMLNVVDANVDAHFVRFDVGAELSLGIGPALPVAGQGGAGLTVSLAVR
ncbi:MAG: DUF5683 domain-containing protein [Flavobacteriales bacterium]|jgi:hypothetical protein|nr:DUF5683 domain-containing protein [Flavobacteriales bacterium]